VDETVTGWLYRISDRLRAAARSRVWPADKALGRRAEDLAHRYLRSHGLKVVARNYRPARGHGEIDLVAWHGEMLVFVEVKARSTAEFGDPDRAIGREKRIALIRTAFEYARRAGVPPQQVRFDVVNIVFSGSAPVEWLQGAFRPGSVM